MDHSNEPFPILLLQEGEITNSYPPIHLTIGPEKEEHLACVIVSPSRCN
jgi:hypothetical protein